MPAYAQLPDLESRAQSLRNGEHVWADRGGAGAVAIVISLADQVAYVYRGGALIGVSTVSTGKPGKSTPVGEFTILQKKVFHRSNLYSNAPMPYMQRLTWTGIALHAGQLPGYPASHGCIRFPAAFAKQLYAITDMGGAVRVVADLPGGPARQQPRELPPVQVARASRPAAPVAPVLVADAGSALRHDDAARAGDESAAPRIELAAETASFVSYDAVFAQGYGARGAN
ncbi:L,D-transpeptidase family protein [Sphingomonas spermidinifaciens]|uniref:L,D-transpeptidase family protein n=1 Tax=Sphingomonas spermidinifaciens TaxID=1141889 RepID=UPI001FE92CEA|nr:L,D-transpeptidase family protein [Sphingomonas spermidinifaciens]